MRIYSLFSKSAQSSIHTSSWKSVPLPKITNEFCQFLYHSHEKGRKQPIPFQKTNSSEVERQRTKLEHLAGSSVLQQFICYQQGSRLPMVTGRSYLNDVSSERERINLAVLKWFSMVS